MIQAAPKGEGGGVHTLDQIPALENSTHTVANTHPTINSMAAQSCKYCSIHQAPPPLPSPVSLLLPGEAWLAKQRVPEDQTRQKANAKKAGASSVKVSVPARGNQCLVHDAG